MSKQTRSQDSNYSIEFEHHWGGERTTIQKIKGWIKKRKPPFDTILMHLFSYVEVWYWEGKVIKTMSSVDSQVKDLHEVWDNEHRTKQPRVEEGVSEVDGLPTLRITNPCVERRSETTDRRMDAGSITQPLQENERDLIPDPWDDVSGDWNDWAIGLHSKYYEKDK
jgi:hypothetical protein